MRASLFLSALSAVCLTVGLASADKRDEHRNKGDMVEKSYSRVEARAGRTQEREVVRSAAQQAQPRNLPGGGETRWNCSGTGDDCGRSRVESPVRMRQEHRQAADTSAPERARPNKDAEAKWNCPPDQECTGVSSSKTGGARAERVEGKTAAERARNARTTNDGKTLADRASDRQKSSSSARTLTLKEQQEAQRMINRMKAAVCKKHGADCGGEK